VLLTSSVPALRRSRRAGTNRRSSDGFETDDSAVREPALADDSGPRSSAHIVLGHRVSPTRAVCRSGRQIDGGAVDTGGSCLATGGRSTRPRSLKEEALGGGLTRRVM
jgi:hypothetical protein